MLSVAYVCEMNNTIIAGRPVKPKECDCYVYLQLAQLPVPSDNITSVLIQSRIFSHMCEGGAKQ